MENIIKQIKKGAKHTHLTSREKSEMKSVLLRHVQNSPVRNELLSRHQFVKGDKSILSPFQINNLRNKKTMPILVMLGLLMGGSASFAAEGALPGDVLYPVKVHVNENVRGAVAVTPKAKAEWEVALVGRRLEEVEKIAVAANGTPEKRKVAEQNLAEYTHRVESRIAKFEDEDDREDAIKTSLNLSDVFSEHEQILLDLSLENTSSLTVGATATSTLATSTTSAAVGTTITSEATVSIKEALEKVRGAQGEAEKKHRELKEKYHQEGDDMSNKMGMGLSAGQALTTGVSATSSTSAGAGAGVGLEVSSMVHMNDGGESHSSKKDDHKENKNIQEPSGSHDEEIRTTILPLVNSSTTTVSATGSASVSIPSVTTAGLHTETQKSGDND